MSLDAHGDRAASSARMFRRQFVSLVFAALRRDWKIAISYRLAFVSQLINSAVTLGFLFFLGRLFETTKAVHFDSGGSLGLGYFPFAVIGVGMLNLVTTELRTVSNQVRDDQTTGTLEALFAMPPPPWLTVMGSVTFQLLSATVTALATVLIAVTFFGMRFNATPASAAFAAVGLLVSLPLFVSLGIGFASAVIVFKRGGTAAGLMVTAFSLLSGVYYPTSVLSPQLRALSRLLPFTWVLDVTRGGLLEARMLWGELALLTAVSVVLVPLSLAGFTQAVAWARRKGTLGQF